MDRKKSAVSLGNAVLSERRAAGRDMRIRVHGGEFVAATDTQIDPFLKMYYDMTEEFCWGTVWARPGLTIGERSMLALSMTATKGQQPAVAQHVRTALRAKWSREQIGEILMHVYCYAGCYAALGAFRTAKDVFDAIDDRPGASPSPPVAPRGPEEIPLDPAGAPGLSGSFSALAELGMRIRNDLFGSTEGGGYPEAASDDDFMNMFVHTADEYCFGSVWARPALSTRHRSMLSLAITATQNQHEAVRLSVRCCCMHGLSKQEIGEILLQVFVYAGMHASMMAFDIAREVFARLAEEGISVAAGPAVAS